MKKISLKTPIAKAVSGKVIAISDSGLIVRATNGDLDELPLSKKNIELFSKDDIVEFDVAGNMTNHMSKNKTEKTEPEPARRAGSAAMRPNA